MPLQNAHLNHPSPAYRAGYLQGIEDHAYDVAAGLVAYTDKHMGEVAHKQADYMLLARVFAEPEMRVEPDGVFYRNFRAGHRAGYLSAAMMAALDQMVREEDERIAKQKEEQS